MGLSTFSIGAAVTPTVIETWCSHYINRRPRKQKPTAHISYDVGLNLIKQFLAFAFKNPIDDLQAFTSQWVPCPYWVRTEDVTIPSAFILDAAHFLQLELGPHGLYAVGGATWWQWRDKENKLQAEWIEMQKDHDIRKRKERKCTRSMLYVHGGAFYFGSVDEHRYQLQRHARKLQARVFAPRYRLAPQYPFPCGLQDCLAAYLYMLTVQSPETIVLAGDSAGGGMVLSMLVILRNQGLPLPAGAVLLSPWVDLTHSFPSCAETNHMDYVPDSGFMHAPSATWPPPDSEQIKELDGISVSTKQGLKSVRQLREEAALKSSIGRQDSMASNSENPAETARQSQITRAATVQLQKTMAAVGTNLSVRLDGKTVEIRDQIQIYAQNHLLSHPLVSPVLQASLGGLPPLCILVGGSELLRDEQIYLAHKAADPASYPPPISGSDDFTRMRSEIDLWPPTSVQLQIWDDLCHVAPTLSFTRPAKYMYRSVSQFSAWALARAQRSEIRILDDDEVSNISSDSEEEVFEEPEPSPRRESRFSRLLGGDPKDYGSPSSQPRGSFKRQSRRPDTPTTVGKAGDPLPAFKDHMIRHRVTRYGDLYALDPASTLSACMVDPQDIGTIKPGPVRKWLAAQARMDASHGGKKKAFQAKRLSQMAETMGGKGAAFTQGQTNSILIGHEQPPPTAWAGMSKAQIAKILKSRDKRKISKGLTMWSGWGSKHDEEALNAEFDKIDKNEDVTMSVTNVRVKTHLSTDALGGIPGSSVIGSSASPATAASDGSMRTLATSHRAVTPNRTNHTDGSQRPFSTPGRDSSEEPQTYSAARAARGASVATTMTSLTVPLVLSSEIARPLSPPNLQTSPEARPVHSPPRDFRLQNGNALPERKTPAGLGRRMRSLKEEDSPIRDSTTLPSGDTAYHVSHRRVYSQDNDPDIPPTPSIPENFRLPSTSPPRAAPKQPTIGVASAYNHINGQRPNANDKNSTQGVTRPDAANNSPSLGTDTPARTISPSNESFDDDRDVQVVAAQAVPMMTPEAARREHARKSSLAYGLVNSMHQNGAGVNRVSIVDQGARKSSDSKLKASGSSDNAAISPPKSKPVDMESWADRVVSEVRTIGSRDGPPSQNGHSRAKSDL